MPNAELHYISGFHFPSLPCDPSLTLTINRQVPTIEAMWVGMAGMGRQRTSEDRRKQKREAGDWAEKRLHMCAFMRFGSLAESQCMRHTVRR